jgi:hypothetical protein
MQDYDELFGQLTADVEEEASNACKAEFSITDDNLADWAVGKIAGEKAEFDRLVSVCEFKIQLYEEKMRKYRERFENKTSYLRHKLMEYFDKVPHKATKTQETYKLPSGTLKRKLEKQDYAHDDEKLIIWLKQNMPDLITEKPIVNGKIKCTTFRQ